MTLQALKARASRGEKIDYLFFWGHTPKGEDPGPWVFSQWWEGNPFVVDGDRYPTAEHFMMAEKARLMGDTATRTEILAAKSPGEVKKLGRRVKPWDQKKWETARFDVVVRGTHAKFSQHEALKRYLVSTGDKVIVEASPNDAIWGIGLAKEKAEARDPAQWKGLNLHGFALMKVRKQLL